MKKFACYLPTAEGELTLSEEPLGKGGEGSVYSVEGHNLTDLPPAGELVAKIYHEPQEGNRGPKIAAMIRHTPTSDSVAWPLAIVATPSGTFQGYLMKKLPLDTYRMWAEFSNTKDRRKAAKSFDVRYALTAALNLALALKAVHESGHKVGDVNESNIFVGNDATVLLVDTDSAQVETPKAVYPCLVGKPEYTAPELSHGSLKDHKRTEESDTFAYSVAIYQLLVGGAHPTDAVFEGEEDPPSTIEKIRQGVYPNLKPQRNSPCKPIPRVAAAAIPTAVRELILQGLAVNPRDRPLLEDFAVALDTTLDNLVQCKKMKFHWYDSRDKRCGWCAHVRAGNPDPWAPAAKAPSSQKSLNPIKLQKSEGGGATKAPRAHIGSTALHGGGAARQAALSQKPPRGRAAGQQTPIPGTLTAAALANYPPISNCYPSPRVSMKKQKNATLLNYSDGSVRPRPGLREVASSDMRLAWQCFVNELPLPLRLSWPFGKTLPTPVGMVVGLLLGTLVSLGWFTQTPALLLAVGVPTTFPYATMVFFYLSVAGAVTAEGALLLRVLNTHKERGLLRDHVGSLEPFPGENPVATSLKLLVTPLVYGPLFIAGLVVGLLYLLLQAMMREWSRTR